MHRPNAILSYRSLCLSLSLTNSDKMLLAPALRELTPAAGSAFSTQSEPLVATGLDGRTESSYAANALHAMADLGVDGFESATIILPVMRRFPGRDCQDHYAGRQGQY